MDIFEIIASNEALLADVYSGLVYDALLDVAGIDGAFSPGTSPIVSSMKTYGPVFTVSGAPTTSASAHESLLAWTEMLTRVKSNTVLVCQPNDPTPRAFMGELSAEALQLRDVKGAIVDGGVRDTGYIQQIGFPVFAKYKTPRDVVASWIPQSYEEPLEIGGKTICSEDFIYGDDDGIIVVPKEHLPAVLKRMGEMHMAESKVRTAIREGCTPLDAYMRHGKF